jgi:hypothetical protein
MPGDERWRGNFTVKMISIFLPWKISLLPDALKVALPFCKNEDTIFVISVYQEASKICSPFILMG